MDDGVLGILGFVLIIIALDVAALRFSVDSRSLTRELPLPGDPVVRISPDIGRHVRAMQTREALRDHELRIRPAPLRTLTPIARAQRLSRPFRPHIASDAYGYPRFDIAAAGK